MFLILILTTGAVVYMTSPAFYQSGFEVIYAGLLPAVIISTLTGKLLCHSLKSAHRYQQPATPQGSPKKLQLKHRVSLKPPSRATNPASMTHLCPTCYSWHMPTDAPSAPWLRTHCSRTNGKGSRVITPVETTL